MSGINSLKALLRSLDRQLAEIRAKQQGYLDIAAEIKVIYNQMADDKELIIDYRKSIKIFSDEEFDTFRGNLYGETYKRKLEELIADYDTVINNLDINMDRLNMVRAQYENKAYQCNGPIGYVQSSINSVVHKIENWVN